MRDLLRGSAAFGLILAMFLAGRPALCFSEACPMRAADRVACKAMGRECCQTQSGGVSHASTLAGSPLAVAPAVPSLKAPAVPRAFDRAAFGRVLAAPALVQGVGLFAFLSTFLI